MSINIKNVIVEDVDKIKNLIGNISSDMYDYIDTKNNSKWVMFYKYLTHSDLPTFGKATKVNSYDKNLLYYIKEEDMINIEEKTKKPFQTAHQSNIGLSMEFYNKINLPNPRKVSSYKVNDYMNVKIVNSNIKYFTSKYTQLVFEKLDKKIRNPKSWNFKKLDIKLSNSMFTEIPLDIAVHGIGTKSSLEFHKLRHHMFKGDTFVLLYEENANEKNLFIILEKNPLFFSIIGETNVEYMKYQKRTRSKLIGNIQNRDNAISLKDIEETVTRQQQSVWRKMLANEMMGYTQEQNQVFCPFTYITANFENLSPLFVASHIKAFSDPNTTDEEKYDINNGLLLCANADSLFDKHLISVNENKELVFSFLLDDAKLRSQLLLMFPIFQPILNDRRMKFLKYHYQLFLQKEEIRKK